MRRLSEDFLWAGISRLHTRCTGPKPGGKGGHPAEITRIGSPGKLGEKPMDMRLSAEFQVLRIPDPGDHRIGCRSSMSNRPSNSSICIPQMMRVEKGQHHDCDQDAPFPDHDHSDSTLHIRDPSEDGNQQLRGLSNAMPQANLVCISAQRLY